MTPGRTRPGPQAVLWDMDGTLVDSERLWDTSMAELAVHLGGELAAATRAALTGSSLPATVATIRREVGLDPHDPAGLEADGRWLLDRTAELFRAGLPWRPGAPEALATVRSSGPATALVTSTYRELTDVALERIGREFFDVTVCGDEVAATKPDPAPYLTAASRLGVDPAACIAVEDSPTGTRSAVAAGATVLVVPSEVDVPAGERRVLRRSLAGLTVAELRALLDPADAERVRIPRLRAADRSPPPGRRDHDPGGAPGGGRQGKLSCEHRTT